jgi:WD40 repeat protein
LAFNKDGSLLTSGSTDKNLYVWGIRSLSVEGESRTGAEIDGIEWFPDQNSFVTCEASGAITRWDVVDLASSVEPFKMLLEEIERDTSGVRREELVLKFESVRSQYDPEVLQDKHVFYIMWQCKKALGLLKGKPRQT